MVTEALNMSLPSKREYLAKIHGRYQRAGRPHKSRILDGFCLNCGHHRKAALRPLPALGDWLEHHERRGAPLPGVVKEKLLAISPARGCGGRSLPTDLQAVEAGQTRERDGAGL